MACAITLAADNPTQAPILALWDVVAALEETGSMRAQGYVPHITLAVLPDLAASDVWPMVCHVPAGAEPLRLRFNAICAFDASPLVLWAAPEATAALDSWHAKVHAELSPSACHAHYRPGAWVPHCTLGTEILEGRRQRALDLTTRAIEPFHVVFDRFECVSFPPVERYAQVCLEAE